MTEKEAWLEVAAMFEADAPTWKPPDIWEPVAGICAALLDLHNHQSKISLVRKREMIGRLGKYFNPDARDVDCEFFWPDNDLRPTRDIRATACCFLAAMCDLP